MTGLQITCLFVGFVAGRVGIAILMRCPTRHDGQRCDRRRWHRGLHMSRHIVDTYWNDRPMSPAELDEKLSETFPCRSKTQKP